MSDLRLLYGTERHRPLVTAIAKLGGLIKAEAGITDATARIDPLELLRQRAQRDLANELIERMGWTLELQPPAAPAPPQQTQAETD
jgi:hypothetical protein